VTAATSELVHALGDVPAIVIGRRSDVLAWNQMGHALFAGHLDAADVDRPAGRPNMARLVFLDAHTRELYADWPSKARAVVGNLRLTGSGDHDRRPLPGHVRAGVPDPRRRDSAVSRLLEPAGPGGGPELLNGLDRLRDRGAPW
jgi:MmyB-like transcription regulator ligand binding domain